MTPEARLAAALEGMFTAYAVAFGQQGEDGSVEMMDADGVAALILAADPTLAADLALAAAVERLAEGAGLVHSGDGRWWVSTRQGMTRKHETPLAAIEEALR